MNYPALFFWAVLVWSATAGRGTLLVLLLASIPFASLALVPTQWVGGVSILPQSIFAVILIAKVLIPQLMPLSPRLIDSLRLRNLGTLALFLLTGLAATLIAPRLFLGEIVVMPMRASSIPDVLSPTLTNLTQSGYVTLSVMVAIAVYLIAAEAWFAKTLLLGVLVGGIVCIATGLTDIVASSTGMESLLEPFRNADYSYITVAEMAGVRRVIGFTPEASYYGPICVQFAASTLLLRTLYTAGPQRIFATIVAAGLVVMATFSTSSTAYFGLVVLGLVYAGNWIRRAVFAPRLAQIGLLEEFFVGLGLLILIVFVLIVRANLFDPLINLVQEVIFNKPMSTSFYERSLWNEVALDGVLSTWGLGIGFGSIRTSNWFVAIISNAGVVGSGFMAIFLVQTFLRRPDWPTRLSVELLTPLKLSLLPALAMIGVVGTGPDFGPWMGIVFGAISGTAALGPKRSSAKRVSSGGSIGTRAMSHGILST